MTTHPIKTPPAAGEGSMSETREQIFTCEGCSKPIFDSDRYHVGTGVELCEECAPADRTTETEWHDISTAPKDGTVVLVCNEWGTWAAKYEEYCQSGFRPENPWFVMMLNMKHMSNAPNYRPTHWMPLPSPPATNPKTKGARA
jgi:hypothetical protein